MRSSNIGDQQLVCGAVRSLFFLNPAIRLPSLFIRSIWPGMTKVKKKTRLATGFRMTSDEIGLEKFPLFLGRFRSFLDILPRPAVYFLPGE
jgi:hypothetical protein